MIPTGIDGRAQGGADQVFNLLNLVSNPDEYAKKVKALLDATEEHKRFVELVGPANDIIKLRDEAAAARKAAADELAAAKAKAKDVKAEADAKARDVTDKAQAKADAIISEASALRSGVAADKAMAQDINAKLAVELVASQKASDDLKSAIKAAEQAKAEAVAARKAADADRERLAAWHSNCLKELSK